jgi:hypothetical protein
MVDIYDASGKLLANFDLSEREQQFLNAGATITRQFHTPQLTRELGNVSGKFSLTLINGKIVTDNPAQVAQFTQLRAALDAREATLKAENDQSVALADALLTQTVVKP